MNVDLGKAEFVINMAVNGRGIDVYRRQFPGEAVPCFCLVAKGEALCDWTPGAFFSQLAIDMDEQAAVYHAAAALLGQLSGEGPRDEASSLPAMAREMRSPGLKNWVTGQPVGAPLAPSLEARS
jgi:hypothetical protein